MMEFEIDENVSRMKRTVIKGSYCKMLITITSVADLTNKDQEP